MIYILATGGTIDKCYPRSVGGYAFEFGEQPAAERILADVSINPTVAIKCERVCEPKDSQDITETERKQIVQRMKDLAPEVEKFIITHGTDTMVETAQYLEAVAESLKLTVCIVGSKIPETFKQSDAAFNLGFAIGAVSACGPGVYVAMNGTVIPSNKVERDVENGMWKSKP